MNKLSSYVLSHILSYSDNCCVTGVNKAFLHALSKGDRGTNLIKILRYVAITTKYKLYDYFVKKIDPTADDAVFAPDQRLLYFPNSVLSGDFVISVAIYNANRELMDSTLGYPEFESTQETKHNLFSAMKSLFVSTDIKSNLSMSILIPLPEIVKEKDPDNNYSYKLCINRDIAKFMGDYDRVDTSHIVQYDKSHESNERLPEYIDEWEEGKEEITFDEEGKLKTVLYSFKISKQIFSEENSSIEEVLRREAVKDDYTFDESGLPEIARNAINIEDLAKELTN